MLRRPETSATVKFKITGEAKNNSKFLTPNS